MEEEFIAYKEALALKELGFDEEVIGLYVNEVLHLDETVRETSYYKVVKAPLYQQAFRWFRKNEGMFIAPFKISYEDGPYLWSFEITDEKFRLSDEEYDLDDYKTYEEAELECLRKLIEIVKK